ncbi:MAG: hypothetical protein GX220_02800 [Treponema sp.]|nr:hypothetical protein [Treponema sp.]
MTEFDNLNVQALPALLRPLLAVCPLWAGKKLHPCIIANPQSGGFTIKKRSEHHKTILAEAAKNAAVKPICTDIVAFPLYVTEYSGHATFITRVILDEALRSRFADEYLIITAGGDGTSLEVQTVLLKAALADKKAYKLITERITVLRLPFGTGNDGTDGRTIEEAVSRLTKSAHFQKQKAVKVYYEGIEPKDESSRKKIAEYGSLDKTAPWYAFNIASVGIDAFITHYTNRFHSIFPGDFYKFFVDVACLFYSWFFPSGKMHVEVFENDGTKINDITGNALFCSLGVSGNRTYGSGQKILPDERNFCFTRNMSNLQKLFIKKKFLKGRHTKSKYATFANASIIRIEYSKPILAQMDGEVHMLDGCHFPLIMELTEPIIRTIVLD